MFYWAEEALALLETIESGDEELDLDMEEEEYVPCDRWWGGNPGIRNFCVVV